MSVGRLVFPADASTSLPSWNNPSITTGSVRWCPLLQSTLLSMTWSSTATRISLLPLRCQKDSLKSCRSTLYPVSLTVDLRLFSGSFQRVDK
ncbi:hypothetical protein MHYP_G00204660 [Metynnis hypsauchen]